VQLGLDVELTPVEKCTTNGLSGPDARASVDLFRHVGFHLAGGVVMSVEVPATEFDTAEPITVAPQSRRIPTTVRLRWTEHPALGMAQSREEAFSTLGEAEEVKRFLEAKGFDVTIG
jgi:hypothetical protein